MLSSDRLDFRRSCQALTSMMYCKGFSIAAAVSSGMAMHPCHSLPAAAANERTERTMPLGMSQEKLMVKPKLHFGFQALSNA